MLDSVKSHVARDGEAFRAISSMVNKTIQAMNQFKVVRKHMVRCLPWLPLETAADASRLPDEQYVSSRRTLNCLRTYTKLTRLHISYGY